MLKLKFFSLPFFIAFVLFNATNAFCQNQTIQENKPKDAMAILAEGRVEEAFKILKEKFDEAQKSGKEDSALGNAINNLGEFYRRINRAEQAETFFKRAAEIAEKVSDKVLEGATKNNLGLIYSQQGKIDQAVLFLTDAVKIREKQFGSESIEAAITLDNIGLAYAYKKDFAKATEFSKKALSIFEKKQGIAGADTIIATNNLGGFYQEQGKIEEATNVFQRQFDLTEKEFGADSTKLIEPLSHLRGFFVTKGDYPKMELLFRRNLELLNKNNIAAYPQKVYVSATLGFALMKQKKYTEAEPYLKQAVEWIEVESAKKSPKSANIAFTFYITFLRETNREKDAVALEEKIKKMFP